MRLEQLRYFVEIAKSHSFGIAANRLFVSQPAVSIAIKSLEQELGETLFIRSKNGVFLTEIGEMILEKMQIIVNEEKNILDMVNCFHFAQSPADMAGDLSICLTPTVNHNFWSKLVLIFMQMYPNMKLTVFNRMPDYSIDEIQNGQCDIGIVTANVVALRQNKANVPLVIKEYFTEKVYAIADESFLFGNKTSLSLKDLKGKPLSTNNFSMYFDQKDIVEDYRKMNIVLKTDSLEILQAHIFSGKSIGIVLNSTLAQLVLGANMTITPLNLPFKTETCCIYREDNPNIVSIESFLTMLERQPV